MPKKKNESVEEKTSKDVSPKEESIRDILDSASDTDTTTETTATTEDTDSEKVEEKKEETKEEPPKEEVAPELKPEEIAQAVKQEFIEKIMDAVGEKKEKPTKDEFAPPWVKENRTPKSYEEVAEWGAEIAEKKREEREAVWRKQQEDQNKASQEYTKRVNQMWDGQLEDLREQGKIPQIATEVREKLRTGKSLTPEEAADEGLVAQRELIQTMYNVSKDRVDKGKEPINNLKEIFYEHYKKEKQPPGADAPISGGKKAIEQPSDELDYAKDVKGKDFYDILKEI